MYANSIYTRDAFYSIIDRAVEVAKDKNYIVENDSAENFFEILEEMKEIEDSGTKINFFDYSSSTRKTKISIVRKGNINKYSQKFLVAFFENMNIEDEWGFARKEFDSAELLQNIKNIKQEVKSGKNYDYVLKKMQNMYINISKEIKNIESDESCRLDNNEKLNKLNSKLSELLNYYEMIYPNKVNMLSKLMEKENAKEALE